MSTLALLGGKRSVQVDPKDIFAWPIINKKMKKTRKPQTPHEEMIECIAIATAGRLSQKEKRKVCLKEVWKKYGIR